MRVSDYGSVRTAAWLLVGLISTAAQSPAIRELSPRSGSAAIGKPGQVLIGWNQFAVRSEDLERLSFSVYIDNADKASPVADAVCDRTSGPPFSCRAHVRGLAPGRHHIALVAISGRGAGELESVRSAVLVVDVR